MPKKNYLLLISFLITIALTGAFFLYDSKTVDAKTTNEKVQQLLKDEYEYDLTKLLVVKKGGKKPEMILLEELETQGAHISSKKLKEKDQDLSRNQVRYEKLEKKLIELSSDNNVEHVQPVYLYTNEVWTRDELLDTPDDFDMTPLPATGNHWYYEKSNLRSLWYEQDCFNSGVGCGGSSSVVVAVIDTGLAYEDYTSVWPDIDPTPFDFDPAPDKFVGGSINLWTNTGETNPNNDIDDDGNGYIDDYHGVNMENYVYCQYNSCTTEQSGETGHPNDDGGHGTFVTGLIASLTGNATGSVSPAHNVSIMTIKSNYYKSPSFGTTELIESINYAVDNGADIINMSLAGSSYDYLLEQAVNEAHDAGVLIIASSGNAGGTIYYPAKYANVVAVGAVKADNTKTFYSAYGPELDLVAYVGNGSGQGDSTYQESYTCFTAGTNCYNSTDLTRYTQFSNQYAIGTSFASPQVAAWAALIKSNYPAMSKAELVEYMLSHSTDIGSSGWDELTGWGVVDYSMGVNYSPTITLNAPATNGVAVDMNYTTDWTANDVEEDASISIYFDSDGAGFDGYLSQFCKNLSEDNLSDSCQSDTRFLKNGTYYVYGCIDDAVNEPVCDYAPGNIAVNHLAQQIETGKVGATNNLQRVTFANPFSSVPVVFTDEISEYGGQKFLINIKNVTTTGFDLQLLENSRSGYDIYHPPEVVNWVAILNSDNDKQLHLANTDHNWQSFDFTNGYLETPKIIAQTQTENGTDIENIDIKDLTNNSVKTRVEEAPGFDGIHTFETVALMTFIDYGNSSQSGKTKGDHNWKSVVFPTPFVEKPIVFGEVTSEVGGQMANIDIRNLTRNGFEFRLDEDEFLHDLWHPLEDVNWLAIPYVHPVRFWEDMSINSGVSELPFSSVLEEAPILFANIVSENGTNTVNSDIVSINEAGFKIRLEEDLYGGWDGIHLDETIHLLATKTGMYDGVEVGATDINNSWELIELQGNYSDPHFFASIQSENGTNTASPDIKHIDGNWYIRVEEDTRLGWDGIHLDEKVGWMVFDSPSVGCWGSKNIDSNKIWQYSVDITIEKTGGNCTFSNTPFLISDINTENGTDSVILDIRNLTNTGFELRLEEEPNFYDGLHLNEKIVWWAL